MADLSPDVRETLEGAAEALGLAVAPLAAKVEQARNIAADLEAELHICRGHLVTMTGLVIDLGTTWSQDSASLDAARAYLEREA